jgi:hypothetical protein
MMLKTMPSGCFETRGQFEFVKANDSGRYSWYNRQEGDFPMTTLLQRAFTEAAKLSESEQEVLASRLLAELAAEDDFDRAITDSSGKLATLANEALAEHRAGQTEPLDPERL